MISLVKNEIERVTVELTVEESIGSQLGGYPTLLIGDVNIESVMVAEVDTLAVIKAIATSESVYDFEWKTKDCWNSKKMVVVLKATAEIDRVVDRTLMIENTGPNSVWLNAIYRQEEILESDESTPWERTIALSKIYDYRQKMTYVPMPKELMGDLQ